MHHFCVNHQGQLHDVCHHQYSKMLECFPLPFNGVKCTAGTDLQPLQSMYILFWFCDSLLLRVTPHKALLLAVYNRNNEPLLHIPNSTVSLACDQGSQSRE